MEWSVLTSLEVCAGGSSLEIDVLQGSVLVVAGICFSGRRNPYTAYWAQNQNLCTFMSVKPTSFSLSTVPPGGFRCKKHDL